MRLFASWSPARVAIALLFAFVLLMLALVMRERTAYRSYGHSDEGLVMYSLTTCGNCVIRRRQLTERGVAFTEYFVDVDPQRDAELWDKLRRVGYKGNYIGTPVFDAGGIMLLNNPSVEAVEKALTASARERG